MNIISIKNLNKIYQHNHILKNISLDIKEGECIGIMGESGSGKSTLGRIIVGLENQTNGIVEFNGIDCLKMSKSDIKKKRSQIQLVFQNSFLAVNPNFTVEDVLLEPLNIVNPSIPKKEKLEIAKEMLANVELHKINFEQNARSLSGGQLQRLCLARALILNPKIIVLDETLSGLDPLVQEQMLKLLANLREKLNLTYIFIAHNFSACYYLCDRIIVMEDGRIVDTVSFENEKAVINTELSKKLMGETIDYIPIIDNIK